MRLGFVYLIGPAKAQPLKIGHATDLKKRLCQLQIGNWNKLEVLDTASAPWTLTPAIEASLHKRFADRRLAGEWFDVPLGEARAALAASAEAIVDFRTRHGEFNHAACFGLCADPPMALSAVTAYRNLANNHPNAGQVKSLNARILSRAGHAAYAMFQAVIVEGRDIQGAIYGKPGLAQQAEASLVKALDTLVEAMIEDDDRRLRSDVDFLRKIAA